MSRRSRAREIALQILYQDEFNEPSASRDQDFLRARLSADGGLIGFASELLQGVRSHRERIDGLLKKWSARWDVSRMAAVDRNILRMGAFEIIWLGTPKPVAVNEAILLAKRYGNQQSFQFINGILDRLSPNDATESNSSLADPSSERRPTVESIRGSVTLDD